MSPTAAPAHGPRTPDTLPDPYRDRAGGAHGPRTPEALEGELDRPPRSPSRACQEALASEWYLAVLRGPDAGLVLPVPRSGAVGRGLVVTDPEVSRAHLLTRVRGDRVLVCDAGSTNGTRLRRRCWRRLTARPRACRAGARLRVGGTLVELRRRPSSLAAPVPTSGGPGLGAILGGGVTCLFIAGPVLLIVHGGGRSVLGAVSFLPMVLMTLMRLLPRGRRAGGRRGGPGAAQGLTGWRGRRSRRPDPAALLLAVAARTVAAPPDARTRPAAPQTPPASPGPPGKQPAPRRRTWLTGGQAVMGAWLATRRRRHLLTVEDGDHLALTGPGARTSLRWWVAQLLARGVEVTPRGDTARLSWQEGGALLSARVTAAADCPVPASALTVRGAPTPRAWGGQVLTDRWWEAVLGCLGTCPDQEEDLGQGAPALVRLSRTGCPLTAARIAARWREPGRPGAGGGRLSAVLGVGAGGPLSADLALDGPHALLAGTTGSGKSELLTAWLLQLACTVPPDLLSLVLVDYKGGSAFTPLRGLPHTAGVLTDLDPADTARALSSLEAEVRRRERILTRAGAKDVTRLPAGTVLPRLLVVVDEFATLACEHPDVLDTLVRVAAQGRSLGIHLVLATQRPGGVVSPAIRANTSLRVCLKVLDTADSREVLGHDGAAHLPRHPGRVIVAGAGQGGGDGGQADRDSEVLQAPWCGTEEQVAGVVAQVREAASGWSAPWRPWAEPLPTHLGRAELSRVLRPDTQGEAPRREASASTSSSPGRTGALGAPGRTDAPSALSRADAPGRAGALGTPGRTGVPLSSGTAAFPASAGTEAATGTGGQPEGGTGTAGTDHAPGSGSGVPLVVTDLPERQCLGSWSWDPAVPLLVIAPPGSGGTTAADCACQGALDRGWDVHLCGRPSSARGLSEGEVGVGTVVGTEDPRRLARLWSLAAAGQLRGSVLRLDDVETLITAVDEALGVGEGQALLEQVVRTAPATGTGLVVTAAIQAASARWAAPIRTRLVLGASDPAQAALAGLPRGTVTGRTPGRGVVLEPGGAVACQVLLPDRGGARVRVRGGGTRSGRPVPHTLRALPRLVTPGQVPAGTWALGGDSASPLEPPCGSVLVVGPPGSGRTSCVKALRQALACAQEPSRPEPAGKGSCPGAVPPSAGPRTGAEAAAPGSSAPAPGPLPTGTTAGAAGAVAGTTGAAAGTAGAIATAPASTASGSPGPLPTEAVAGTTGAAAGMTEVEQPDPPDREPPAGQTAPTDQRAPTDQSTPTDQKAPATPAPADPQSAPHPQPPGLGAPHPQSPGPDELDPQGPQPPAPDGPDQPLVVDDLDLAPPQVVAQVEAALAAGRQVIASATTQGAVGTYRGALATLKERADLVILWPGLGPASQVSHLSLHGTVDPRALTVPGRGVLVSRRSVTPLQCVGPAS